MTEYSLSVDNLFVFIIIMGKFAVPRQYQQKVLLVGVALALVMRGIFIAVGAEAIAHFNWVFYIFGALPALHRVEAGDVARRRGRVQGERRARATVRKVMPTTESTTRRS